MRWIKAAFSWLVDEAIEHAKTLFTMSGAGVMA